ncbi:glycosyltransferase 61 family protein [Desulfovibrio desulfuricans]|uniref:glycosyltransferase 61 family protein n=1 Tax=Desulfovibrio desulfuricans TaxID=876 RepID=UPI001454DFF4|nr:glycosyltransferase 61 family protein [Desulfovibrio desulfuricans]
MFGHFGRLYAIRCWANVPLLFSGPSGFVVSWRLAVLELLSLDKRVRLISEPVEVTRLIVSPPGATVLPDSMLPEQLEALGSAVRAAPPPGRKIWLSRSAFPYGGVVENEPQIERDLQTMGWEIVHPEQLLAAAQARAAAGAEVVAGFDGSAFFQRAARRQDTRNPADF